MRIGLDATYSLGAEPTGIAEYSQKLIRGLAEQQPADRFVLCYRSHTWRKALRQPPPTANCTRAPLWLGRWTDLFHGLNQRLPPGRFRRAVATFHDLFVMTAEYSTADFRRKFTELAQHAARRSDLILAVSQFTADQTAELLDFPRDRIRVVPHGVTPPQPVSAEGAARFRRERGWDDCTVYLHVGALQARKNIVRLVEAFEALPGDPLLALAGGDGYGAEAIHARIDGSRARARILRLGYVDAATRALLYASATALAFPSLDEGFGIPLLEAFAAGLPSLTSDRSALPEVAGGAALLVDPLDVEDIRAGLRRVADDPVLRDQLIRKGLERARELTWERTARLTWQAYQELLR
ncbi:MAG: glycosyltransferase [Acidobacteria bacterium]|nr:glycosyltransferase [Acidobacteriota bacterium]